MLAGAIQQYLRAAGLASGAEKIFVSAFGDYSPGAPTSWAVNASPDRNVELVGGTYSARVQIRARAADAVAAENAGREAFDLLLAADGDTLVWDDPSAPPTDRSYLLEAISVINRPTWYPTPEAGEECSCNLALLVTEV